VILTLLYFSLFLRYGHLHLKTKNCGQTAADRDMVRPTIDSL